MKKIVLLLSGIILLFNSSNAQDKSFHKGTIAIDFGIGLSVFGTAVENSFDLKTNNTSIRIVEKENSTAAATVIPFNLEYGINNWLGIGARFAYSKYFANADSTNNNTKPTVKGYDGDLLINFHFIKTKRFDLPICFIVGYSNFKYKANNLDTDPNPKYDNGNSIGIGNGVNYGISLVPRIYFGDHIGVFFNLGYMGYNYPNLKFSNNSDSNVNNDNNKVFKLKGNGSDFGLGLIIKF